MEPPSTISAMQELLDQLSAEMARLQSGLSDLNVVLERTRKRHGIDPGQKAADEVAPSRDTGRE